MALTYFTCGVVHVIPSASVLAMPKETSTRARVSALIDVWQSFSKLTRRSEKKCRARERVHRPRVQRASRYEKYRARSFMDSYDVRQSLDSFFLTSLTFFQSFDLFYNVMHWCTSIHPHIRQTCIGRILLGKVRETFCQCF